MSFLELLSEGGSGLRPDFWGLTLPHQLLLIFRTAISVVVSLSDQLFFTLSYPNSTISFPFRKHRRPSSRSALKTCDIPRLILAPPQNIGLDIEIFKDALVLS